jgi:hypothetical protein
MATDALHLTYVTAERCHFCERGREVLAELADTFPLTVRAVDLASAEGRAIAAHCQVPYPPIVLLDGAVLAFGRLSVRRLARELSGRRAAVGAVHP